MKIPDHTVTELTTVIEKLKQKDEVWLEVGELANLLNRTPITIKRWSLNGGIKVQEVPTKTTKQKISKRLYNRLSVINYLNRRVLYAQQFEKEE